MTSRCMPQVHPGGGDKAEVKLGKRYVPMQRCSRGMREKRSCAARMAACGIQLTLFAAGCGGATADRAGREDPRGSRRPEPGRRQRHGAHLSEARTGFAGAPGAQAVHGQIGGATIRQSWQCRSSCFEGSADDAADAQRLWCQLGVRCGQWQAGCMRATQRCKPSPGSRRLATGD
ncbi:hypothetical protein CYMTET_5912 [Cymbomonas tetramitiformis]|uniref:Uncharacterized protein n=1 Tax=Cymbomonas tetramitiformis TaxID=36881 RepID=A0AAE0LJ04_9CHLO|nr:hypothetical protein CYMTET_5912 [Cymbomonas tetramitiformis]